jgi:hypothetical protein
MRRGVLLSMLVLGLIAVIGAGSAQAKLDSSFGEGGVLHLQPPLPAGWHSQLVKPVATGPEGQVFLVDTQFPDCTPTGCPEGGGAFVHGFLPNGAPDTAYPAIGYKIPSSGSAGVPLLGVSSSGLALVAHEEVTHGPGMPGSLNIQRLLPNGAPDPSFGLSGAATFSCNCGYGNTRLLAAGNATLVTVTEEINTKSGPAGAATIYKLNGAGLPAQKYGSGGAARVLVPGQGSLDYQVEAPNGATYFGGIGKSSATNQGTIAKVSADGKVNAKFTKTATASLKRLLVKGNKEELKVTSAVIAADGKIQLFGTAGTSKGFELVLRASGALETKFGNDGLRRLGRSIVQAVPGSEGAAMVLAQGQSIRLVRILADGRPDPAFGKSGEEVPGQTEEVPTLLPGGKGAVEVIDLGITACRGVCQSDPKAYRFLEH